VFFHKFSLCRYALVNCCTIDWFTEWPAEALQGVGMTQMKDGDLNLGDSIEGVVSVFR